MSIKSRRIKNLMLDPSYLGDFLFGRARITNIPEDVRILAVHNFPEVFGITLTLEHKSFAEVECGETMEHIRAVVETIRS